LEKNQKQIIHNYKVKKITKLKQNNKDQNKIKIAKG